MCKDCGKRKYESGQTYTPGEECQCTILSTDKKCCVFCEAIHGQYSWCKKPNCPCHQAPTHSLSEGEEWEKLVNLQSWHQLQSIIDTIRCSRKIEMLNADFLETLAFEIRTLLSQTLSNERQRMVEDIAPMLEPHIADILDDEAPVPREIAIEKYAEALVRVFHQLMKDKREALEAKREEYENN